MSDREKQLSVLRHSWISGIIINCIALSNDVLIKLEFSGSKAFSNRATNLSMSHMLPPYSLARFEAGIPRSFGYKIAHSGLKQTGRGVSAASAVDHQAVKS